MALSNLFRRSPDDNATNIERSRAEKSHHRRKRTPMDMSRRPPFGQWLKSTWLDIFTMVAMGIIGLGVSIVGL